MRKTNVFYLGWLVAITSQGCSLTKLDDINEGNAGYGGTAEIGGAGGEDATGGKATKGGTSAKDGSTAQGGTSAKDGSTAQGGSLTKGGSSAIGGETAQGGTSTSSSTSSTTRIESAAGNTAIGGTTNNGGTSTGGVKVTGGTSTGGTSTTGGSTVTGGTKSTGGISPTGGTTATSGTTTGSAPDTVRPQIIGISPNSETRGVTSTSNITITFSEPMNTNSVAQSLSVSGIVSSDLTLSWDTKNTTLTITPKNGLAYAQGTDPVATAPRAYVTTIASDAKDVAGNKLTADFTSTFYTLRRLTQTIVPTQAVGFITYNLTVTPCDASTSTQPVGYLSTTVTGARSFPIAFDLPSLGIQTLESAILVVNQASPDGDFYSTGKVEIEQDQFESPINTPQVSDFTTFATLGTFASGPTVAPIHFDVTTAANSRKTQKHIYRLTSNKSPKNTYAMFYCDPSMIVRYLVP
jgi:hypothetical protein